MLHLSGGSSPIVATFVEFDGTLVTLATEQNLGAEKSRLISPAGIVTVSVSVTFRLVNADSDDLARVYRFDLAQGTDLILAHHSDLVSPRGARCSGYLVSGIGEAAWSTLNRGLKSFFVCCGQVGNALRVSKRGMSTAHGLRLSDGLTGSPQALAVEIDAVGVMDQAVEGASA